MRQYIRVTPRDNVATLLLDLPEGGVLELPEGGTLTAREAVPYGHKIALRDIPAGGAVIKYGEVIGRSPMGAAAGSWVHTHNCVSGRGAAEV